MTGKEESKKKNNSKAWKYAGYVVGSAALCAAACLVLPEAMMRVSGKINKQTTKLINRKKDDDWGPEIVKKEKAEDENNAD